MTIKNIGTATAITVAGLAASLAIGAGSAAAAPSGPSTAADTIARLQANGNTVIVNKVGTGPIDQCTVESVRPVQTRPAPSGNPLTGVPNLQTTMTVHVGLKC
jgi:hypothetical protein